MLDQPDFRETSHNFNNKCQTHYLYLIMAFLRLEGKAH